MIIVSDLHKQPENTGYYKIVLQGVSCSVRMVLQLTQMFIWTRYFEQPLCGMGGERRDFGLWYHLVCDRREELHHAVRKAVSYVTLRPGASCLFLLLLLTAATNQTHVVATDILSLFQTYRAGQRNHGCHLPRGLSRPGSNGYRAHFPTARRLLAAPALPRRAVWQRDHAQCCCEHGAADLRVSADAGSHHCTSFPR